MRFIITACCCVLAGCVQMPDMPQEPVDGNNIEGASLGAPQEHDQEHDVGATGTGTTDNARSSDVGNRDVERDIIVKHAGTDDEIMVSPPVPVNPLQDREALHKGQRVEDFAQIDQLVVDGYETVYFSKLSSYVYFQKTNNADHPGAEMTLFMQLHNKTDAAKGDAQIPADIRALDGKKVAVPGFMLPASELKDGMTNDFLLVQVLPSCFFCRIPNVTEWISCLTVDKKRLPFYSNKPVLIKGSLRVGAHYVDGDYLEYIYRIDVESVDLLN